MLDLVLFLWCLVGLPPFVALETALLAGLEHRENTWKHLFALPVPRWTIYVPKVVVALGLVCVSSLVLALGTGLEGLVLSKVRPDLDVAQPIPWVLILSRSFSFVPAVLLVLAVQTWVATRWRSFSVAMGLGVASTVVAIMLLRSLRNIESTPYAPFLASLFPWSLPYVVLARQATPDLRRFRSLSASSAGDRRSYWVLGGSAPGRRLNTPIDGWCAAPNVTRWSPAGDTAEVMRRL